MPHFLPRQELRQTIDLIIMPAMGEGHQFGPEVIQPGGVFGEVNMTDFNIGRLRRYAVGFRAFRPEGDRTQRSFLAQLLDQVGAGTGVFNVDVVGGELLLLGDEGLLGVEGLRLGPAFYDDR